MIVERDALLKASESAEEERDVIVDCGRGVERIRVRNDALVLGGLTLPRSSIESLKEDVCYLVTPEGLKEVAFFGEETGKYYKLHATGTWPTVEISSTPMHRHSEITPEEDTRWKVRCISPVRGVVLDTCCGLGYTAILAAKHAALVHTFEIDPNMVRMMRYNPWSRELFEKLADDDATAATIVSDEAPERRASAGGCPFGKAAAFRSSEISDFPNSRGGRSSTSVALSERRAVVSQRNIMLHEEDVREGILEFADASFDRILHDPPTFKFAGELYSLAFYRELRRVLKRNGSLYHYTPSPGKKKGRDFVGGVLSRLKQAGFTTRYVAEASGIVARPT